ncbi:MAG TPA: phosphoribosyltransferase family protein [Candidatus Saccharibacteria bacterium]|nr:phosphoribosyltransferase family protein [Candidatus Saccharibacteria bacterium]HRK94012.1 phosphoribosyltransferase family protein [Candidatus Saccharibacteria bacterium]
MIDEILQIVAPHHCYGCGNSGAVLCPNCKYDIIDEASSGCIVCQNPAIGGICSNDISTYDKAWYVGDRADALRRTIDAYKFERVRAAHKPLVDLLNSHLPVLPFGTAIVPVPTIATHIRQRGYDHTKLIARRLAAIRKRSFLDILARKSDSMQRGASRKQRFAQAETAFICRKALDPTVPYLLIDDIMTTGATLRYAAKTLKDAGADEVWVAVLARQPLDRH